MSRSNQLSYLGMRGAIVSGTVWTASGGGDEGVCGSMVVVPMLGARERFGYGLRLA